MVKCINCGALDIGFNKETDAWVHCSINHARDIRDSKYREQPKITEAIAQMEINCQDFKKSINKNDIYKLAKKLKVL